AALRATTPPERPRPAERQVQVRALASRRRQSLSNARDPRVVMTSSSGSWSWNDFSDRRPEILNERVDLRLMGSKAEHAYPAEKTPARERAAQHAASAGRCSVQQLPGRAVFLGQCRGRPCQVKCEQGKVGGRIDDDAREPRDALAGVEGKRPLLADRGAKGCGAEHLDREPHSETGESPGELGAVLAGIVELLEIRLRRQIRGAGFVSGAQRRGVADDQRARAVWQKHSLVRVERQRVGA